MKKVILSVLIDEYIDRHRETLDLLIEPEWVELITKDRHEVFQAVKGKPLDELDRWFQTDC